MKRLPKQEYTAEFKELAVKRVKAGQQVGDGSLVQNSDRVKPICKPRVSGATVVNGMVCSMSRKGNCWDNAPTESFFNSVKNERVNGTRYRTRAEAFADLFDYIVPFYNRKRHYSTLGYASLEAFLERWISAQHEKKLAA